MKHHFILRFIPHDSQLLFLISSNTVNSKRRKPRCTAQFFITMFSRAPFTYDRDSVRSRSHSNETVVLYSFNNFPSIFEA